MKICIPIRENSYQKTLGKIIKARKAEVVEIWLDHVYKESEIRQLIRAAGKKEVIVVCRGDKEKGDFLGSEIDRIAVLKAAVRQGATFVDIGFHTSSGLKKELRNACKKHKAKLIISLHNWEKTPPLGHLKRLIKKMQADRPDIIKIATMITGSSDVATLFELCLYAKEQGTPFIVTAMGPYSAVARIGTLLLGGYLTYVALDEGSRTAPGQPTYKEVMAILK